MQRSDVMHVLNDPLAQELIRSNIPARVAYTSLDGSPRAVPLGFHWNGAQFVICTIPGSPKVRALAAHPQVALTIDTDTFPPHVLLVRGSASLETVEGVPPEYLEAARKQVGEAPFVEVVLKDGQSEVFPFEKVIKQAQVGDPGDLVAYVAFARTVKQVAEQKA